ncbi:hypothetical protein K8I85_05655, partial [bacterium]|nr:hypothetical protein [bacterium]
AIAKAIKAKGAPVLTLRKLWDTPPPWSPDPRKVELALWVGTRSRELGMRLSPDDCAYLAAATGNDLAAIDTQLEKIRQGGSAKLREIVTRRGVATAIVAPDGAGKSTVIASLEHALFFRVKTYYLGLEGGIFANRPPSRIPGGGIARRALHAWSVYLKSRADLSRRRLVLFDRYPYEALLPPDRPLGLASRVRRAAMGRLLPPPHLVVFLDAPGAVLHARKQEHSVERLERDRQGYLSLAQRGGWTVVDATQDADTVRRDVTDAIWRAYRRRFERR